MTAAGALTRAPAGALAAACALLWFVLAPPTPDLAAQVYRSGLFDREGFALFDVNWFGGHHLPGYSLLFPPLGSLLGPRTVGVGAAIVSAVLFERLARRHWGPAAAVGIAWFAAATCADLLIGRLTYTLGVAVGLGAMLALQRSRPRLATALAVATTAASPVAGLFVALAGATLVVVRRDRAGAAVAIAALGSILALAVAFPEGGRQPMSTGAIVAVVGFSLVTAALLPERERVLRVGALLYAASGLLAFAVDTPVGSNVTRLGATFAGPLLACAAFATVTTARRRAVLLAAAAGLGAWQWMAPVRETAKGATDPSTQAAYFTPLVERLRREAGGEVVRVEVPFTRGHWEAVHLARHAPLARGWETQLDTKLNPLFFGGKPVGVNAYRSWLRRNAVGYVAVPSVPLDPSGRAEARLVALGVPYLRRVAVLRDWTLYAVADPRPLVEGPATLERLDADRAVLRARRAGHVTLRIRHTPFWSVDAGAACVTRAPGDWTRVRVRRAGRVVVQARIAPRRRC